MTEADAIELILEHLKGLFPRKCSGCNRTYATFVDYLKGTEPVGRPLAYDLESGNLDVLHPAGGMAFSRCSCGATIALSPKGMPLTTLGRLLIWAKLEIDRRGMKPRDFLEYVRAEVRKKALLEPSAPKETNGTAEATPPA